MTNGKMKSYEVTARPTAPGSTLPVPDPMRIEASDALEAVRQYRLLVGIDEQSGHRYTFAAVDSDPARRDRARTASTMRPVPAVTGYGFRK